MKHALDLFVYGTLKRGFAAHENLCAGAAVSGATVRGKLFALPQGYPALVVEDSDILARATEDPAHDAAVQAAIHPAPHSPGDEVFGELLTFAEPRDIFPIDAYEGFIPGGDGNYDRVAVASNTASGTVAAWTYVVRSGSGRYLEGGSWPEDGEER